MAKDSRIEDRFISTVVLDECAKEAYGFMQDKWLESLDAQQAWSIIRTHFTQYGTTITREEFHEQFPGYAFIAAAASVTSLMDNMQKRYVKRECELILDDADPDVEDPIDAVAQLITRLRGLQAQVDRGTGEDIAASARETISRYADRKLNKGCLGKTWPWLPMQEATLGAQDGMYAIFYARPKNMKSWLAVYLIVHWYVTYGVKILVVNRELTKAQFQDRLVAMLAGVPYDAFRRGTLTGVHDEAFRGAVEYLTENGSVIIEAVYSDGAEAAAEVDALCEKYEMQKGDLLIIDGMYFYAGSADWALMRAFSGGVQRLTKKREIVTIATTQGNRQQGKNGADAGEELGLGDGPAQDCDMATRVTLDDENKELTIAIRAIREGTLVSFVINSILCNDFTVKYTNDYLDEDKKEDSKRSSGRSKRPLSEQRQGKRTPAGRPALAAPTAHLAPKRKSLAPGSLARKKRS